jgi:multiple sugar transport system substrate-binding protein
LNLSKKIFNKLSPVVLSLIVVFAVTFAVAAETVTIWVGDGDVRLKEYQAVADLFMKQNPGIKIELQLQSGNQTQVMQKLALAIVGGAPPDLSWVEGSAVIEFAAQGLLMDVTDTIKGLRYAPADTQEMTFNGRMYAVPYHTAARGLFKRVDFFENAGLNPNVDPKSLEQMYEWHQKLTDVTPDGRYNRVGMMPWVGNWGAPAWIWSFGGELVQINGSKITVTANTPQNIAAFEWIQKWAQSVGSQTPVTGGHNGFVAGTVAMSAESTSSVNRMIAANVPFTTGRVPNAPGGRNGTWGGGTAVGVPINAPNPELSLRVARFFGSTEAQVERFSVAPDTMPANWDALLRVGQRLPKEWIPLLDQFPEARPRIPLWIEYYVNQLTPALNNVVSGQLTPQQALMNVQQVMEIRYAEVFGN